MKIVVVDGGWGPIDTVRQYLPKEAEFVGYHCHTEEDILAVAKDADAILAEYAPLSRKVLKELTKCKIISNSAVGTDNIDIAAATEFKIAVANVPGYCSYEVAEHALALLLAVSRNIVAYEKKIRQRIWDIDSAPPMKRLSGQTLGLIGFGQIAQLVAQRALSFGMTVLTYDPYISPEFAAALNVRLLNIQEVLEQSDIVSMHLPLNEHTLGFINKEKIAMMKKKPLLINTSRGKTINEADLIEALNQGAISAAALDVLVNEPPDFNSDLFKLENVILTPHAGFYSETSVEELRQRCALNVTNFFNKNYSSINILNKEILA